MASALKYALSFTTFLWLLGSMVSAGGFPVEMGTGLVGKHAMGSSHLAISYSQISLLTELLERAFLGFMSIPGGGTPHFPIFPGWICRHSFPSSYTRFGVEAMIYSFMAPCCMFKTRAL